MGTATVFWTFPGLESFRSVLKAGFGAPRWLFTALGQYGPWVLLFSSCSCPKQRAAVCKYPGAHRLREAPAPAHPMPASPSSTTTACALTAPGSSPEPWAFRKPSEPADMSESSSGLFACLLPALSSLSCLHLPLSSVLGLPTPSPFFVCLFCSF